MDHGQCGWEDVISEIWSSSSPVIRDLVQCGRDHAGKHFLSESRLNSLSDFEGSNFVCREVW